MLKISAFKTTLQESSFAIEWMGWESGRWERNGKAIRLSERATNSSQNDFSFLVESYPFWQSPTSLALELRSIFPPIIPSFVFMGRIRRTSLHSGSLARSFSRTSIRCPFETEVHFIAGIESNT